MVSAVVDVFDDATGTWSVEALSRARGNLAATSVGTSVLFAGGTIAFPSVSDDVDLYDALTGAWSTASLGQRRTGLAGASVGHEALFGGGLISCLATCVHSDLVDRFEDRLGTSFCSPAVPNSTGSPARVWAGGTGAAGGTMALVARELPPGQPGYFLTSRTPGLFMPPSSAGFLCLSGDIGRFNQPAHVGQGPTFGIQVDLAAVPQPAGFVAVQPGETWNFQCWYRDAGNGNNFTDAVSVAFR